MFKQRRWKLFIERKQRRRLAPCKNEVKEIVSRMVKPDRFGHDLQPQILVASKIIHQPSSASSQTQSFVTLEIPSAHILAYHIGQLIREKIRSQSMLVLVDKREKSTSVFCATSHFDCGVAIKDNHSSSLSQGSPRISLVRQSCSLRSFAKNVRRARNVGRKGFLVDLDVGEQRLALLLARSALGFGAEIYEAGVLPGTGKGVGTFEHSLYRDDGLLRDAAVLEGGAGLQPFVQIVGKVPHLQCGHARLLAARCHACSIPALCMFCKQRGRAHAILMEAVFAAGWCPTERRHHGRI